MTTIKATPELVNDWTDAWGADSTATMRLSDYIAERAVALALGQAADRLSDQALRLRQAGVEGTSQNIIGQITALERAAIDLRSAVPTKGEGHE